MTLQRKATIVSSSVALILVVFKLIAGILSGSVAVLASAIDSGLDLAVSLFNYYAIHNSEKPADEQFNYGRGKIEALAAVVEGAIITLSGIFILYKSAAKILSNETLVHLDASITVMFISLALTGMLVLFLSYVANKTDSMVIRSDALHYKTDLFSNAIILVSLAAIYITGEHIIDAILGMLIALYIIYSAYELIRDGVMMLMDAALDEEIVKEIKLAIRRELEVTDYHWLKTRKAGSDYFVDVHLVFSPDISLYKAHLASDNIEARIRKIDEKANWVITIHMDPYDDSEINASERQN